MNRGKNDVTSIQCGRQESRKRPKARYKCIIGFLTKSELFLPIWWDGTEKSWEEAEGVNEEEEK